MAYELGAGSRCVAALQTAHGSAASPTQLLNMRSESIQKNVTKTSEESLMNSILVNGVETTGISVSGGISTYLRPEFTDWLFSATCNIDSPTASQGVKTYTLAPADGPTKFSTIILERGSEVKKYQDAVVSSLTLTCNAGEIVTADFNIIGEDEDTATFPASPAGTVKKSYRCNAAVMKIASGNALPVETLTLTIDNGVQEGPKTYLTGIKNGEASIGRRNVSINWTMPKDTDFNNLRSTYLEDGYFSLHLEFTNDGSTGAEKIEIDIPNLALQSANANVSGPQRLDGSLSAIAVQVGTTAPFSIKVKQPSA